MEDFYKQFKDNLENRPEPRFEEKDWQVLEKKLDQSKGSSRKGLAWWWLLPVLLLPLLIGNAFFFLEWKKTNRKYDQLSILRDTIYLSQTIIQRDTVYQERIIREQYRPADVDFISVLSAFSSSLPNFEEEPAGLDNAHPYFLPTLSDIFATAAEGQSGSLFSQNDQPELSAVDWSGLDYLRLLPAIPLRSRYRPLPRIDDFPRYQRDKQFPLSYHLHPKGMQLGLSGGVHLPVHSQLNAEIGGALGLEANIRFSEQLRLWLQTSYYKSKFESKQLNPDLGIPPVDPPGDNYTFDKASLSQSTLRYALGMQYLFLVKNKWTPYLGLGYGALSRFPYEINYQFEDIQNDLELNLEQQVDQRQNLRNLFLIRAGVERKFSKDLYWYIEGQYWQEAKSSSGIVPNNIGLRTGLNYDF